MNSDKVLPVYLDVDTGVDDALAILLAVKHPALEVRGVTTVVGNVDLEQVTRNTLIGNLLSFTPYLAGNTFCGI